MRLLRVFVPECTLELTVDLLPKVLEGVVFGGLFVFAVCYAFGVYRGGFGEFFDNGGGGMGVEGDGNGYVVETQGVIPPVPDTCYQMGTDWIRKNSINTSCTSAMHAIVDPITAERRDLFPISVPIVGNIAKYLVSNSPGKHIGIYWVNVEVAD